MTPYLIKLKQKFDDHMNSVRQLMNFDRVLLDVCIMQIEELEERIKNNAVMKVSNPYLLPTGTLKMLRSIRENDSLRPNYQSIFNQCLVLTVSYYTSIIGSVFRETINYAGQNCPALIQSSDEDFKITLAELRYYNFDLSDNLGDLIVKKKDISFQDMQSITRSFKSFLNIEIARDADTNNIIVAQASRHAIVHSLCSADEKFIKQIANANPRDLLTEVQLDAKLSFNTIDLDKVIYSMERQLGKTIDNISEQIRINSR